MPFHTEYITVRSETPTTWCTLEDLVYEGREEFFTVPAGFHTDFASVPRVFTWMIPRYGVYTRGAILHDMLCHDPAVSRRDADGIFRRVLGELGTSLPRRWMMWAAVRVGGGMSDATFKEWMQFLLVAVLSILFLIIPVVIVQLWLLIFWLIEKAFSPQDTPEASIIWTR